MDGDQSHGSGQVDNQPVQSSRAKPQLSTPQEPEIVAPTQAMMVLTATAWCVLPISPIPKRKIPAVHAVLSIHVYSLLLRQIVVALMAIIGGATNHPSNSSTRMASFVGC